jgi:type 1 glutamine amidotransferase
LPQIEAFLNRGGGLVLSHYVLWNASPALADLLGLAKGKDSHYKHKVVTLKLTDSRHPILLGLPDTFTLADECFWNLQGDRSKVTALATSDEIVGDQVRAEPVIWAYERGKGRVVASTLGHFDWTFDDPFFRTLLLRGIAWAAGESPYRFDPLIRRGIPLKD